MHTLSMEERSKLLLRTLGFAPYHSGYRRLCLGLPYFAQDPEQGLFKELYLRIAAETGTSIYSVEASIRRAVLYAWEHSDRAVWEQYFPGIPKAPSNQILIATLAEYLKTMSS